MLSFIINVKLANFYDKFIFLKYFKEEVTKNKCLFLYQKV